MSNIKTALTITGVAVIIGLLIVTGILSFNNGKMNREIENLKAGNAKVKAGDRIVRLENRLERLDGQVQKNVDVANGNYEKYNRLVKELDFIVKHIKGTNRLRLLSAIDKIKDSNFGASGLKKKMERENHADSGHDHRAHKHGG